MAKCGKELICGNAAAWDPHTCRSEVHRKEQDRLTAMKMEKQAQLTSSFGVPWCTPISLHERVGVVAWRGLPVRDSVHGVYTRWEDTERSVSHCSHLAGTHG